MAKNLDILAKKQIFRFLHDRGLFICFLGREIDWYMLKFVKITRNHFSAIFWQKMAKNADILAKIQNFRFLHDRGLFICFLGREIDWYRLKFVKIIRNHFFSHFLAKNGQKSRHFGQKTKFTI